MERDVSGLLGENKKAIRRLRQRLCPIIMIYEQRHLLCGRSRDRLKTRRLKLCLVCACVCVSSRVELSLFKEQPWPPTVPVNCPVASDNNITQVLDGEDMDVDVFSELF